MAYTWPYSGRRVVLVSSATAPSLDFSAPRVRVRVTPRVSHPTHCTHIARATLSLSLEGMGAGVIGPGSPHEVVGAALRHVEFWPGQRKPVLWYENNKKL